MRNRPTLSLIAAAFLCAAYHAPSCAAEKPGIPFHFPKTIGDLPLAEIRQPTETNRATRVFYGVPGITLTLYIFGSAPEAPDGIESPQLNKEFEEAKQSVQDPRAWVEAKLVHEGTVDLGVAPHRIPAREAVFNVKSQDDSAISCLCLTAAQGLYFKIRYTVDRSQQKVGEQQLAHIYRAVGELIESVGERKGGPA